MQGVQKFKPVEDNRYRIYKSELAYGLNAYIDGRVLYLEFSERCERKVYMSNGSNYIQWMGNYHRLFSHEDMSNLLTSCSQKRLANISIGHEDVKGRNVRPFPFFFLYHSTANFDAFKRIARYTGNTDYLLHKILL